MELLTELVKLFGSFALIVFGGGWILKTVLLESLKRESDSLISQIKQQADVSLEQLKQQGERELEGAKQKLEIEKTLITELKTEFMAEQAINRLLSTEDWKQRSFNSIKKRIAGFSDDELRQLLVRSGAVRFIKNEEGVEKEFWGLLSRNSLSND